MNSLLLIVPRRSAPVFAALGLMLSGCAVWPGGSRSRSPWPDIDSPSASTSSNAEFDPPVVESSLDEPPGQARVERRADREPYGRARAEGEPAGDSPLGTSPRRATFESNWNVTPTGNREPAPVTTGKPVPRDVHSTRIRGQNAVTQPTPGAPGYYRQGMPAAGARTAQGPGPLPPPGGNFGGNFGPPNGPPQGPPNFGGGAPPIGTGVQGGGPPGIGGNFIQPPPYDYTDPVVAPAPGTPVPFDVYVEETRTGRFVFGVGVNSDAGVTGQIVIDERNFDITRFPRSFAEVANGTAFRGAGQGFRIEAMPGDRVQRYLVSFTEPYLLDTPVSLNLSGSYFDRRFFDWDEQRLGGRAALGYRLTHDMSISGAFRGENVKILRPRVPNVPELDEVVGSNNILGFKGTIAHDTRDVPFAPTEGHLLELSFEQVIGTFDYPRAEIDYRQHFLMRERPDGSGRHTLSYMFRVGFTGSETPIFENYFAGGFSTLRGFDFRGASPVNGSVIVGGEFRFLGSVEYMFPLTADDMIKGVVFCDFGTVEEKIEINANDYRVAVGAGLRISIPALGPAPLALDFAVPLANEDTDEIQNFSFFFGLGRG